MKYKDELIKAMSYLADDDRVVFIGQCVRYPGHLLYTTLDHIPASRRLEFPVAEDMQMGVCIGLALTGVIPISIYPRMDFLLIALNQLVNHLDKFEEMTCGQYIPKVIIRTMLGSIKPIYPGVQHSQDHTEALKLMLTNVDVVKLQHAHEILPAYEAAMKSKRSTVLVDAPVKREGYED